MTCKKLGINRLREGIELNSNLKECLPNEKKKQILYRTGYYTLMGISLGMSNTISNLNC